MKKFITIAALVAASTAVSNAATLLVTFGRNNASGDTATTLTVGSETWNFFNGSISVGGEHTATWSSLKYSDGSDANAAVTMNTLGSFGGGDAVANSFTGSSDALTNLFPSGVWKGALHSGQATNATSFTVNGLVVGNTYTLQVLVGSGSNWLNGTTTCSVSSGATISSAKIVAQNGNDSASFGEDNAIAIATAGGSNTATAWAVLEYELIATGESVTFQAYSGSSSVADDVGGFRLSGDFIPEPSAFGLFAGIGALALAVSRRKRR